MYGFPCWLTLILIGCNLFFILDIFFSYIYIYKMDNQIDDKTIVE